MGSPLIAKEDHSSRVESTVTGPAQVEALPGAFAMAVPRALVSTEAHVALSQGPTQNLGGKRSTHVS